MQFLVICRPAGGNHDESRRLLPSETEALRRRKAVITMPSMEFTLRRQHQ